MSLKSSTSLPFTADIIRYWKDDQTLILEGSLEQNSASAQDMYFKNSRQRGGPHPYWRVTGMKMIFMLGKRVSVVSSDGEVLIHTGGLLEWK